MRFWMLLGELPGIALVWLARYFGYLCGVYLGIAMWRYFASDERKLNEYLRFPKPMRYYRKPPIAPWKGETRPHFIHLAKQGFITMLVTISSFIVASWLVSS